MTRAPGGHTKHKPAGSRLTDHGQIQAEPEAWKQAVRHSMRIATALLLTLHCPMAPARCSAFLASCRVEQFAVGCRSGLQLVLSAQGDVDVDREMLTCTIH